MTAAPGTTTQKQQQSQENVKAENKQVNNKTSRERDTQFNSIKLDLKKQLEYYFSRQNLAKDTYLVSQMDSEDYVPIALIAGFRRVRERTSDLEYITSLLRSSNAVTVDETGTKVKPNTAAQRNTVILRDLPESTLEEVNNLLKELDSPPVKSIKQDFGSMWYVTLRSEEDAVKLLFNAKGRMFKGEPFAARIKSEPIFKPRSTTIVKPSLSAPPTQPYGFYYTYPLQQLSQQLHQYHPQQTHRYYNNPNYQNNPNHQNSQHHQHYQYSQQQQQPQHLQLKNSFQAKKNHQNHNRYGQKYNRHVSARNQLTNESRTNNVANLSLNNNKQQKTYKGRSNNDNNSSRISTGDNNQNNNSNVHANSNTKNNNAGTDSNNTSSNNNNIKNNGPTQKKYNNKQHKKIRQDRKKSGKQAELMQSNFPPLPNQKVSTESSSTANPVTQEKPVIQEQPMTKLFSYADILKRKE